MKTRIIFLQNILQLVLSPSKGWEDVSGSQTDTKILAKKCMYPMFILAALSIFVQWIYHSEISLSYLLIKCCVIFVSYFVAYIFDIIMYESKLDNMIDGSPNDVKISTVVIYGLSLLSISTIICNVIPVSFGLTVLLPLCVALIVWKSGRYLCVKSECDVHYGFFVLFVMALPPLAIQYLFDWILTS